MSESAKPADSGSSPRDPPMTPGLGEVLGVAGGVAPPPAPSPAITEPVAPSAMPDLERRLRSPRTFVNAIFSGMIVIMAVIALAPLFSVLATLIYRGGQRLGPALFTELPPAAGMRGGGIGNAVLGTILMVGIASLISVPAGILGAVYTAEFGPETKTASIVRFAVKVLSGLPSVLAGLFAYAAVVLWTGQYSAVAGVVALSILMVPTVLLTAEQAIRMVPQRMRDADAGDAAHRAADGHARHPHRCDVGGRPRRRRNRAALVHGDVQQLLAHPQRDGADAVAGGADFQLFQLAVSQSD